MKKYQDIVQTSPDPRDGHRHEVITINDDGTGRTDVAGGEKSEEHSHDIRDFRVVPMESSDGDYVSRHPGAVAGVDREGEETTEVTEETVAASAQKLDGMNYDEDGAIILKDIKFAGEKNDDGTYNIRNVPVFADHRVPNSKKFIGAKWLNRAVVAAQKRFHDDGFQAPLHIQHHGSGNKPEPAGFFMPTGVKSAKFEGRKRQVVFADLMNIPAEVFSKIKAGLLPYRSVEILDINKPEISSLALLDTEVPFFRLAPLKVKHVRKASKLAASCEPVLAYRAGKAQRMVLCNFGDNSMKQYAEAFGNKVRAILDRKEMSVKDLADRINAAEGPDIDDSTLQAIISGEIKTPSKAAIGAIARALDVSVESLGDPGPEEPGERRFQEDDKMGDDKKKKHDEDEEHASASRNFMMDEEATKKMMGILEAIAKKLGVDSEDAEDALEEMEDMDEPGPAEIEEAKAPETPASVDYSLKAKVAALESFKRGVERRDAKQKLVTYAQKALRNYHMDDQDLEELDRAANGGKAHVETFISTMKRYKDEEPAATLDEAYGAGPGEVEELQAYAGSPQELAAARTYSAYYDELRSANRISNSISRHQFIRDQFGLEPQKEEK